MMENIIRVEGLSFSYDEGADAVLRGIDLEIGKGEFVAVVGHNGSGKSTLARQMNAILLPSGGKVLVKGMDTADEELLTAIRTTVGIVFQNPDNQLVASIVEEDVAFGPENLGVPNPELRNRVDEALKAVGMYDYRRHAPHKLSGGQKQRIAIAGIIAMQPECIVLDEPTAMLDPKGRNEVMTTIRRLCDEKGITIVLITHYMDEAAQADRVVVVDDGKVLTQGTAPEIFSQVELLRDRRLDVPQACELAFLLKKEGMDIGDGVLDAQQCAKAIAEKIQKNG
ncbi:MAG: energy-coupling factor transporter ATPase [Ruminococcaceae bacterium]|nr:energy-coupling factor transporter ATPase [Oscillospiraceae bacterium]